MKTDGKLETENIWLDKFIIEIKIILCEEEMKEKEFLLINR